MMKSNHLIKILGVCMGIGMLWFLASRVATAVSGTNLSADEAKALIEQYRGNEEFVILDIRTPGEYAQGHINGSILLDFYSPGFKQALGRLDRGKTYLIYCRSGSRSSRAMAVADQLGFENIYQISKGIIDWQAKGYPLVHGIN